MSHATPAPPRLDPCLEVIEGKLPNLLNHSVPVGCKDADAMLNKKPSSPKEREKQSLGKVVRDWLTSFKRPETVICEQAKSLRNLLTVTYLPLEDKELKDCEPGSSPGWALQGHFWRIATARKLAADWNRSLDRELKLERSRLLLLVVVMAVALAVYDNWFGSAGMLLLTFVVAAAAALTAAWLHFRRRRVFLEEWVNETRAISEILRVQFFWSAAGMPDSAVEAYHPRVAEKYPFIYAFCQRVSGSPGAGASWKQHLEVNPANPADSKERDKLMEKIRSGWLAEQESYFDNTTTKLGAADRDLGKDGRFWLVLGFTLLVGRVVISPEWLTEIAWPVDYLWLCSFLATLLLSIQWFIPRVRGKKWLDGFATAVLGIVGLLALAFAVRAMVCDPLQQQKWFDSISGLAKTLALAYGTIRSFQGSLRFTRENVARYSEMHNYFKTQGEKFDDRLGKGATLDKLHEVLRQTGRAALRENAEWLQMHRDRPLDLFTPPT